MAHPVDVHVGMRIRQRRWFVGMTQQQLAEKVGIKFQQIQKYETGANRVSASRMWVIAKALGVTVSHFFEGLEDDTTGAEDGYDHDAVINQREAQDLLRVYYAIPPEQRRHLLELARAMAAQ